MYLEAIKGGVSLCVVNFEKKKSFSKFPLNLFSPRLRGEFRGFFIYCATGSIVCCFDTDARVSNRHLLENKPYLAIYYA